MCGIAGEIRFDGQAVNPNSLQQMTQRLVRRGPDGEGRWHRHDVALAHRRLAILDLSERGAQPMHFAQTVLVFNGTIYNHQALRAELQQRGHIFVSTGDTEVILHAYTEWGEDCVSHLLGMFAFAIWDDARKQLFCARDRVGIKPFYYTHTTQFLRFASTTQALLATGEGDTAIDPIALHYQLTLHAVVPAPHTILQGVRKLPPAHTMTVDLQGKIQTRRYWHLQAQRPAEALSEVEWQEQIHQALYRAVARHQSVADVPVGVLLSGGLDSSLLVAMLAKQGVSDLRTFSIGFDDHPDEAGNEFEYSDLVAQHFATRHTQYRLGNDQVLQYLPAAIANMSEPMVSQDVVAFYLLAERVSQQVKVVQSGQGADEVFGGYFWYPRMMADRTFAPHYFDRDHHEFLEAVQQSYHGRDYSGEFITQQLNQPGADSFIDQVLRLDSTLLITDDPVKRVDNMTMTWGLEARVPFLDHELIELAAQLPPELKLASGGKHILKNIARQYLPAAVIDRPKGYFPVPALKFIQGEFLTLMADTLNSTACRQRGLFNPAYINKLLSAPDRYFTRLQGSHLWHLALLELWLQQVM